MDKEQHVNMEESSSKQCCEKHFSSEHSYAIKVKDKVKLSTNHNPSSSPAKESTRIHKQLKTHLPI